jgi:outer membrane protein TolC
MIFFASDMTGSHKWNVGHTFALAAAVSLLGLSSAAGASLSVTDYLGQVAERHDGVKAAVRAESGARGRAAEGEIPLSATLFVEGEKSLDASPKNFPAAEGERVERGSVKAGVSKVMPFGATAKVYYSFSRNDLNGADPNFVKPPSYYQASPVAELSVDLWRNALGRETKAGVEASRHRALSRAVGERMNRRRILSEAEQAYWNLAAARRVEEIARQSLARAEKLRDWAADRVSRSLADRSDLLEAEAAARLRALDLRQAEDDRRGAERVFEVERGGAGGAPEELAELADDGAAFRRASAPDEITAALHDAGAAAGDAALGVESTRPKVEVYAAGALNGRRAGSADAVSDSFGPDGPRWAAGARVSVPLDLPLLRSTSSGHRAEAEAAAGRARRAEYESAANWKDLSDRLDDARRRVALAKEIEDAQRERVEVERRRHGEGRTTTFFVVQAEQDWAAARRRLVDAQLQARVASARMKPYSEEN